MSNKFDKHLFSVAKSARKFQVKMTGLENLRDIHESFYQNFIAIEIHKRAGLPVYVDATPAKLSKSSAIEVSYDEEDARKSFDLVFWHKSKRQRRVKAILEIKSRGSPIKVRPDIKKVQKFINCNDSAAGYVLYYTQTKKLATIKERIYKVAEAPDVSMVEHYIDRSGPIWGIALYRC